MFYKGKAQNETVAGKQVGPLTIAAIEFTMRANGARSAEVEAFRKKVEADNAALKEAEYAFDQCARCARILDADDCAVMRYEGIDPDRWVCRCCLGEGAI